MRCPRCNDSMRTVTVGQVELDTCDSCEGVWFDREELRAVLDMDKSSMYRSLISRAMDTSVDRIETPGRSEMKCPRCGSDLIRYNYQGYSGILLDGCDRQCGIWLDDGELRKLFDYMAQASKPDPAREAALMGELNAIKTDAEVKRRQVLDSIVTMDNRGGMLKVPGMVLQGIVNLLDRIGVV